jgi:quercetin dioxygenase-like cupin family protein
MLERVETAQREGHAMLTRRAFAACAFCATDVLAASGTEAETAAAPGMKSTLLKETDGPAQGYITIEIRVDLEPNAPIPRHTHPGVESGYVVEGATGLDVECLGALTLRAGDAYQAPTGAPHSGHNGQAKTVIAATFVVEKGKPLASDT